MTSAQAAVDLRDSDWALRLMNESNALVRK